MRLDWRLDPGQNRPVGPLRLRNAKKSIFVLRPEVPVDADIARQVGNRFGSNSAGVVVGVGGRHLVPNAAKGRQMPEIRRRLRLEILELGTAGVAWTAEALAYFSEYFPRGSPAVGGVGCLFCRLWVVILAFDGKLTMMALFLKFHSESRGPVKELLRTG